MPIRKHTDYCQHFLLMGRVMELCIVELHTVKCNWLCCFPGGSKTKNSARSPVASVTGHKDTTCTRIVVINDGETVTFDDKVLDRLEGRLVF